MRATEIVYPLEADMEGCPIHPTRVDSCFNLTIRPKGCRFEDPLWWNRHESSLLLSIRHAGSRFARDLINIAHLGFEAWLKMLSIRHDSIESTRIVCLAVNSSYRKSIRARLSKYSASGLWRMGWKCCRFDSIRSNRHKSCPLLSIRHTGSRFARDLVNIAHLGFEVGLKMLSIRHDSIESQRIVSLAVDSSYRKSICARLSKYSASGLWVWVENVVDSTQLDRIDTNRVPCCRFVIPEVDLRET